MSLQHEDIYSQEDVASNHHQQYKNAKKVQKSAKKLEKKMTLDKRSPLLAKKNIPMN